MDRQAPQPITPPQAPAASLLADAAVANVVRLSGLLQTSLDLKTVLGLFLDGLGTAVRHDGAVLTTAAESIVFGRAAGACAEFPLTLDGETLGALRLFRRSRFSEAELAQARELVGALLYPLRNTLLYQRALEAAYVDALTGVRNRAAMDEALAREVELARRHGSPLSILVIDLDRFKRVNDRYGHTAGDAVLRRLARLLRDEIRGCDLLFRFGGEEFTVLLSNTPEAGALQLGQRLCRAVRGADWRLQEQQLELTVSIGAASLAGGESAARLFQRADRALYAAKRGGRDRVCRAARRTARSPEA